MNLHRLIAITTLSAVCLAAGVVVAADPVTFDGSAPATATNGTLIRATAVAFPTTPQGPLDELEALLSSLDSLSTQLFPTTIESPNKLVVNGGTRHSGTAFASHAENTDIVPSIFALNTPQTLKQARAEEINADSASPNADGGVHIASADTVEMPRRTPGIPATFGTRAILQTSEFTQANPPPPDSVERLYNQHRLFSNNPEVPFAEYDESDHNINDLSADAFQNFVFVPDRPFPMNQPVYSEDRDYTKDLEIIGGIGLLTAIGIDLGTHHHRPIPETSSVVGLAALCAGGSLALIRARRRAAA